MTHSTKPVSALRQRMIEDMTLRKLSPKTQSGYLRAVANFTRFFVRAPDQASVGDLRRYQLHMVEQGVSNTTINATISGLRFFFEVTLDRPETMQKMSAVYEPRKLPVILSAEEVKRLLEAAPNLKSRSALSVAYGAGLRASEVTHLKVSDIDSDRMIIRVEQGKGRRDRYAMLAPSLLKLLRAWWVEGHRLGKMLPGGWLFPGIDPVDPLSTRQLNRVVKQAADALGSTSGSRCTRCGTALPRTCSSRRWTSVSSRCSWDTRSSTTRRVIARWPPRPCRRSPVPWSI